MIAPSVQLSREDNTRWLAVGAAAFLIRFLASVFSGSFTHPDVYEYDTIARSLLSGEGFVYSHLGIDYRSYAPPLYVWISALVYGATGNSVPALLIVQMVVSAANVSLAGMLGQRLFGHRGGLAAAALMAVHPGLVFYSSSKAHTLTFDAFFFTLVPYQLMRLRDNLTRFEAARTGAVLGLTTLSRSTGVLFLPVGLLWLLWTSGHSKRHRVLAASGVVAVVVAAVVLPWTARNVFVHDRLVFSVTTDAEVFWRGNNPAATGHSYATDGSLVLDSLSAEDRRTLLSRDEPGQADWFRAQAIDFVRTHPWQFAQLTASKLRSFWWFSAMTGVEYPGMWLLIYAVFYGFVLIAAVAGVWIVGCSGDRQQVHGVILLLANMATLSIAQSLFYVEGRHRWAIEPLLLVLAGLGMSRVLFNRMKTVSAGG